MFVGAGAGTAKAAAVDRVTAAKATADVRVERMGISLSKGNSLPSPEQIYTISEPDASRIAGICEVLSAGCAAFDGTPEDTKTCGGPGSGRRRAIFE
jgi:hypothetical protein